MSDTALDLGSERLQQIRNAALDAFLMYGFKRTSMEDIAEGAGMSRAALYLHFKNKRDIFRSVVEGLCKEAHVRMEDLLDPKAPVAENLTAALVAKDGGVMARVLASPHGAEVMGIGQDAAADVAEAHYLISMDILERYFHAVLEDRGAQAQTPPHLLARHIIETVVALQKVPDDGNRMMLIGRSGAALLGVD